MNNPRILLATPISDDKRYILIDWLIMLDRITYPVDILLVDNSHTTENYKLVKKMGYNIKYYNPSGKTLKKTISDSRNMIREYAVKYDYDFIFSLECDIFPPLNVVEYMLAKELDVVSAFYFNGEYDSNFVVIQKLLGHAGQNFQTVYNFSVEDGFSFVDGKTKEVYSAGLGCMLISRKVFSNIVFRADENQSGTDDVFFAEDLHHMRIPLYVDTNIHCVHRNREWVKFKNK